MSNVSFVGLSLLFVCTLMTLFLILLVLLAGLRDISKLKVQCGLAHYDTTTGRFVEHEK